MDETGPSGDGPDSTRPEPGSTAGGPDAGRRREDPETGVPGPLAALDLEQIESTFAVSSIETRGEQVLYYGKPLVPPETAIESLWPAFREAGYETRLTVREGQYVLVAEPASIGIDGVPWTNLVLFLATVLSTLFAGAQWYYIDVFSEPAALWRAWPFTAAVLGVLGVHELGHYVMSRYHHVDASLPYFIPVPTLIGTMGAVIKMNGRMPSRKALFDIGIAGPVAGLLTTVAVTVIGIHLPPVHAPAGLVNDPNAIELRLGFPPLLELLAAAFDQPLYRDDPGTSVNPVVVGGWVGMFVTFLNLIPVGQLDGGHIVRATLGRLQETIGALVPVALFGLAAYLYYVAGHSGGSVFVWTLWGVLAVFLAVAGPAEPMREERLGVGRIGLAVLTFALGALCFVPVPLELVG